MKDFQTPSVKVENSKLFVLDQTLIPHEEKWFECESLEQILDAIVSLKVRGAPLIGIAAALFLEKQKSSCSSAELSEVAQKLEASRPTAVNLKTNIDEVMAGRSAYDILEQDMKMCEQMAEAGAALVTPNEKILTHCNTGVLATAGRGTALGVITKAQEQGKKPFVWVDETRPLLQGGRLTAWELGKAGVEHRIVCDNMAASLMQSEQVDKIFIGSDRICRNGDFANKIGSYSLAVLAKHHNVPFYVVAPESTLDLSLANGAQIEIEQRSQSEVKGFRSAWGEISWSPTESKAHNPAFDVTPHSLVTGWVLNTGVFSHAAFLEKYGV